MRAWIAETRDTYLANPTATRDFRTQLRGIKPILLWSAYLLMLVFVGMSVYGSLEVAGGSSLAQMQYSLKAFYGTILALLAGAITLVTPALTASSIASERQRRSLDLILSTPLHIKSYLVGKLIASYRYTWMLLLLSLPLVSMCIVLGGATWVEVLVSFVRLSLFGLLFTAIGLLMSVVAPKAISAIVYSYMAVGFYLFISTILTAFTDVGSGPPTVQGALLGSLNPFYDGLMTAVSSFTGTAVAIVWIPLAVFVALMCKLLLLAAGSAMSGYASPFTVSLRIQLLVANAALVALLVSAIPSSMVSSPMMPSSSSPPVMGYWPAETIGLILCLLAFSFHWLIPFAACFSPLAEKRFQPDGLFSVRRAFIGTPSGALPYLLMHVVVGVAAAVATFAIMRVPVIWGPIIAGAAWALGYLAVVWAFSRLCSMLSRSLTSARGVTMSLLVAATLMPIPILQVIADGDGNSSAWNIYPLYSVFDAAGDRLYMGIIMMGVAVITTLVAGLLERGRETSPQVRAT